MNKKLVRSNYESCLNSAARLAAYATSKPFEDAPELNQRQDILAVDDLISFCIHARRLIESVEIENIAKNIQIISGIGCSLSLWKIIGYLIHHDDLEIIRSAIRLRMAKASIASKSKDEFWEMVMPELTKKSYSEPIPPMILFKSDKIPYTPVSLTEIVQKFSEKVTVEVIRKAVAANLYLEDDAFEDLNLSKEEAINLLSQAKNFNS